MDQSRVLTRFSEEERGNWRTSGLAAEPEPMQGGLVFFAKRRTGGGKAHELRQAIWERDVQWDLSRASALLLRVETPTPEAILKVSIAVKTRNGWMDCDPLFESDGQRQALVYPRGRFEKAKSPDAWKDISGVRLTVWSLASGRAVFIRPHALIAVEGGLHVVQGTLSCKNEGERKQAQTSALFMSDLLSTLYIPHSFVTEEAMLDGGLQQASAVLLPYNPNLPAKLEKELAAFLAAGGKAGVWYSSSEALARAMGFRRGRYTRSPANGTWRGIALEPETAWHETAPERIWQKQGSLILAEPAAADARVAAYWCNAALEKQTEPALLVSSHGFWATFTLANGDNAAKADLLAALAVKLDPRLAPYADKRAAAKRPEQSPPAAGRSIITGDGPRGKMVGIWDHSGLGLHPGRWDATAEQLARSGINTLFANFAWGGEVHFDADCLPLSPAGRLYGNQVEAALQALAPRGIGLHFWIVLWKLDGTSDALKKQLAAAGLLQETATGTTIPWLSPHHPANRMRAIALIRETARKYPALAGIHLDYVRLPNSKTCYSAATRQRFEAALGRPIADWPAEVLPDGASHTAFRRWRTADITAFVALARRELKRIAPQMQLSCAVFGKTYTDGGNIGQDWAEWLRQDLVDFVVPMNYTGSRQQFRVWLAEQLTFPGAAGRIYPGIGAHADESSLTAGQVARQILEAERQGTPGYVLFSLTDAVADRILPALP